MKFAANCRLKLQKLRRVENCGESESRKPQKKRRSDENCGESYSATEKSTAR